MAVISIHETTFDDQRVYVEATVEDMVLVHAQTMLTLLNTTALCEASLQLIQRYHSPTMELLSSVPLLILTLTGKSLTHPNRYLD